MLVERVRCYCKKKFKKSPKKKTKEKKKHLFQQYANVQICINACQHRKIDVKLNEKQRRVKYIKKRKKKETIVSLKMIKGRPNDAYQMEKERGRSGLERNGESESRWKLE